MKNPNMRYIDLPSFGVPEAMQLAEGAAPEPGPKDVLIEVAYAGVNRPDVAQRLGRYNPPPGASPVLGLEVSGTIVAAGKDVGEWKVGDAVCALTPGGGYAEKVVTPAAHCLPIPRGLSMLEAAALPENFFTVWVNAFEACRLRAGETFLVHGGSSGIGLTAIQLAKAFGATVFTTAGSQEKTDFCRRMGADHAINYRAQDFVAEIHDTHHPLGASLYFEEQKPEAKKRTAAFLASRMPKYLDYFERVLERNGKGPWMAGRRLTYVDLSTAQVLSGLQYAFPSATRAALRKRPRLARLHEAVFARPRIRRYLACGRRLAFNNDDVFRRYPELGG